MIHFKIIFGNLFNATHYVIVLLMWLYMIAVGAYWILGWFPPLRGLSIYHALEQVVEPVLVLVRRLLRRMGIDTGTVDLSPLIVLIAVFFLGLLLSGMLANYAEILRPGGGE